MRIVPFIKRTTFITIALMQIFFYPAALHAEGEVTPAANTTTAPTAVSAPPADPAAAPIAPVTPGPSAPNGPDANTFRYNETTGLWENDYYTWNPTTKQSAPKTPQDYSYNPATGHWDTTEWRYDAPSRSYKPNTVSTDVIPASAMAELTAPGPITATTQDTRASSLGMPVGSSNPFNNANSTSDNSGNFNLFYNSAISNNISATSRSGDSTVSRNTLAGNAVTGDALTAATVLNMLQSVWNPANGDIATFTTDINGDVFGDITIDPGQIPQNVSVSKDEKANLDVHVTDDKTLTNKLALDATSGNASVTENTSVGNAQTGTATAVANVVNMLNSIIGSGQSFVGTVNINGNLDGDILLPPDMINQLLASNVPRATLNMAQVANGEVLAKFQDNTGITNNVSSTAVSGAATADSNTTVGNVGSGAASTNVTILNLTGRQIVGSNALLVFVNVMGEWVGMIMDAPGSTAAALGSNISSDSTTDLSAVIDATSNNKITNDITLGAKSGDATAARNTKAGNVQTGDAKTSASVANVSHSNLSLSGWFGVLFLNVFGKWHGSFGVNTSAGDPPAGGVASSGGAAPQQDVQVFRFTAGNGGHTAVPVPVSGNLGTGGSSPDEQTDHEVLGTSTSEGSGGPTLSTITPVLQKAGLGKLFTLLSLSSLMFLGSESFLSARKRKGLRAKFVEPFNHAQTHT